MKLRKLRIRNFRGIKKCDWHILTDLVCLVGSGDSTKTTLLDAMGLALSRSYRPQFTDADFYQCDLSTPIVIEAVVTDLPDYIVQEGTFGKDRSGIRPDGSLEHDPVDGTEECLIVRLTVDDTLEPMWQVVRPGEQDGRSISATQRQHLGFFRVGEYVDLHLRWGRTSALSGLTESQSGASSVILTAQREARQAVFSAAPKELQAAADTVQKKSRALGSARYGNLRPGLDPTGTSTAHSLVLHDEEVPLTNQGLGTRRLTSLSIQEEAVQGGSIVAIDEIEYGLEPHRLSHALRYLKDRAHADRLQVFVTTHSPVTVAALSATDLAVVATSNGNTTVLAVSDDLEGAQGAVRSGPSALLGNRIVVGEGATEVGLVRELCVRWDKERAERITATSVTAGLAVVDGGGSDKPVKRGTVFAQLGYPVTVLMDNDDSGIDAAVAEAKAAGVTVLRWSPGRALEDEIVMNLPEAGLLQLVAAAITERGEESIRASIEAHLDGTRLTGSDPSVWLAAVSDSNLVRAAIAAAAKGKKPKSEEREGRRSWFKRESGGEILADLIMNSWTAVANTSLGTGLNALRAAVYADPLPQPLPTSEQSDGRP